MRNILLLLIFLTAVLSVFLLPHLGPTMRPTAILLIVLAAASSAIFLLPRFHPPAVPTPVVVHSQGPTIEKLERLSQLVTTRVQIADVLTGEGSGCKGAWLIKGDALIAVDLSKAAIIEKDEAVKRATIRLPLPQVLQARLDHSRTKTWQVQTTTFIPWASHQDSLRDAVMREAQELVAHSADSAENIQQAKASAEAALKLLFAETGWTLTVIWAHEPAGQVVTVPAH